MLLDQHVGHFLAGARERQIGVHEIAHLREPRAQGITFTMEQFDNRSGSRLRASNRLRILSPDLFVTEDLDAQNLPVQRTYYRRLTK